MFHESQEGVINNYEIDLFEIKFTARCKYRIESGSHQNHHGDLRMYTY